MKGCLFVKIIANGCVYELLRWLCGYFSRYTKVIHRINLCKPSTSNGLYTLLETFGSSEWWNVSTWVANYHVQIYSWSGGAMLLKQLLNNHLLITLLTSWNSYCYIIRFTTPPLKQPDFKKTNLPCELLDIQTPLSLENLSVNQFWSIIGLENTANDCW
jgi:hypothetical protein